MGHPVPPPTEWSSLAGVLPRWCPLPLHLHAAGHRLLTVQGRGGGARAGAATRHPHRRIRARRQVENSAPSRARAGRGGAGAGRWRRCGRTRTARTAARHPGWSPPRAAAPGRPRRAGLVDDRRHQPLPDPLPAGRWATNIATRSTVPGVSGSAEAGGRAHHRARVGLGQELRRPVDPLPPTRRSANALSAVHGGGEGQWCLGQGLTAGSRGRHASPPRPPAGRATAPRSRRR